MGGGNRPSACNDPLVNDATMKKTADIHAIQAVSFQFVVLSLSLGGISRAVFGHLPYWTCFMLTEMYKVAFSFFFGLLNVSAFLQMAIILDIRNELKEYLSN